VTRKPTKVLAGIALQKAKSGLPLTPDQYEKVHRSAKLADEAQERKRLEREAAEKAKQ
jgi:hypothetical protein